MNAGNITKAGVWRLAVLAICAAPIVLAVERSRQPALSPAQAGFDHPRDRAEMDRQRGSHLGPVTEEEWKAAEQFLREHSKIRFGLVSNLPGETREGLKRTLVRVWRSIEQVQSQSPELYKTRVREVELEDQIFGICRDMKSRHAHDTKQQADLNAAITELFNLGLTERKERIGLVEKSLVVQKKSLENDERDKAKLIEQQYEMVLARGVEGARLDGSHRPKSTKPGDTAPSSPGEEK